MISLNMFTRERRRRNPGLDAETGAMGLAGAVIGVLPDDDHLDLVEGGPVERLENFLAVGINGLPPGQLRNQELFEFFHVGPVELLPHNIEPAILPRQS